MLRTLTGIGALALLAGAAHATTHTYDITLNGDQEVPPVTGTASGTAHVVLDDVSGVLSVSGTFTGLTGQATAAHVHANATRCATAGVLFPLTITGIDQGTINGSMTLTPAQVQDALEGLFYVNVHTAANPNGEIRGQIRHGESFCDDCDAQALSMCPCSNSGDANSGCENSASNGGARLWAVSFTPDGAGGGTAMLEVDALPPANNQVAVLIRSSSLRPAPRVFGDGLLCIDNPVRRLQLQLVQSGGVVQFSIQHGAPAGTYHYQVWYADNPPSFCDAMAGWNLSNGLTLTW